MHQSKISHNRHSRKNTGPIRNERGFTLLELIVVIIIVALMASMVAPKFFGYADQARQTDAQAQIELLGQALDLYRLEKGKYPSTEDGLAAIKTYLKKEIPKDPWGNEYRYESPGQHGDYDLVSYGADNTEGGQGNDADIVSWKGLDKNEDS
ncbi:MAG: type II secretion system major pseudopilin GspG [Nitrospina sp.]|nr:type II secretion system major pseudopilin GspG [Nitrospina sp.]